MGDSLYNVPAFLTANHWAKKSESFLYSFDHKKTRKCGRTFLSELPIVKAKHASDDIISHGDDLGYIFKENSIFGEPSQCIEELNEENERVENIFTNLIAEFAKSGKPDIRFSSQNNTLLPNMLPKFSDEINPFISITSTPRIMEQFRYCEMGMWTGLEKRLQSTSCNFLKSIVDIVDNTEKVNKTVQNYLKNEAKNMSINNLIKIKKYTSITF